MRQVLVCGSVEILSDCFTRVNMCDRGGCLLLVAGYLLLVTCCWGICCAKWFYLDAGLKVVGNGWEKVWVCALYIMGSVFFLGSENRI